MPDLEIETTAGRLRGVRTQNVLGFLGIPYAAPPTGEFRFAAPRPPAPWPGVRDASRPGPGSPQPPSRLEQVVGPMRFPQSEDCLWLSVWTPELTGRRPVLVFLHGGAYLTGSACQDWYSGTSLAERDIVVVSVNYRLGALGFLSLAHLPGEMGAGNAGLLDQAAALGWVRQNIAAFGGDPDRITLAGQSAGAWSVLALARGGAYRRLILQSLPGAIAPSTPDHAAWQAEHFLRALGLPPGDVKLLRTLPVSDLLAAQQQVMLETRRFMDLEPPFQLVADGDLVPADLIAAAAPWITDLLAGSTRDETNAWYAFDPTVQELSRERALEVAREWYGQAGPDTYAREADASPDATPAQVLGALANARMFREGSMRLVAGADRGYAYQFDWHPHGALGACHCMELPFTFGQPAAWREAPMLAGSRPVPPALVEATQAAWASFIQTGDPNTPSLPSWPAGTVMHLDTPPTTTLLSQGPRSPHHESRAHQESHKKFLSGLSDPRPAVRGVSEGRPGRPELERRPR